MFMRTSTHNTVVMELNAGHRAEVADLKRDLAAQVRSITALDHVAAKYREERDEARAELARWKPARDARGHFIKVRA
ncbi:hypothetical protein JMG10_13240 [Nostoc ellipsosporum NOK]|nr:hypothetical protein [Nostoc ellipsosporum NOK]